MLPVINTQLRQREFLSIHHFQQRLVFDFEFMEGRFLWQRVLSSSQAGEQEKCELEHGISVLPGLAVALPNFCYTAIAATMMAILGSIQRTGVTQAAALGH